MRLLITTIALGMINALYVPAYLLLPDRLHPAADTAQRLLLAVMVIVTLAWIARRENVDYRRGYRQGLDDAENYWQP